MFLVLIGFGCANLGCLVLGLPLYFETYKCVWEKEEMFKNRLISSKKVILCSTIFFIAKLTIFYFHTEGQNFAYCKVCNLDICIKAGKLQIEQHAAGQEHDRLASSQKTQKTIKEFHTRKL